MYLLVSSMTSLVTNSKFIIKFWFVILSQINVSISLSVRREGCISIKVILKFFLYVDGWLNACVAVERAMQVFKGVNFNKKKSKHVARQTIIILPFCIMCICTLMHELIYRRLFVYQTQTNKTSEDTTDRYVSSITHYSPSVQHDDTAILFLHLVLSFLANLLSPFPSSLELLDNDQ